MNKQTKKKRRNTTVVNYDSLRCCQCDNGRQQNETNKQNSPYDASSRRSVVNRGRTFSKTGGKSCKDSET